MKRLLFLIFFLTSAAFANPAPNIGVGGEGVLLETQIYSRDLYDYDLHLSPWIGPAASTELKAAVVAWNPLQLSDFECELLARKLTDLNRYHNYLGEEIFEVLRFFSWRFTEAELGLTYPDEARVLVSSDQRVPIVNRHLKDILIQRATFSRLDERNKVALIIHEAVHALLHSFEGDIWTVGSMSEARQVTASFFDESNLRSPQYKKSILPSLAWGWLGASSFRYSTFKPISFTEKPSQWMFALMEDRISLVRIKITDDLSAEKVGALVRQSCQDFFAKNSKINYIEKQTQSVRSVTGDFYNDPKTGIRLFSVQVDYTTPMEFIEVAITTPTDCEKALWDYIARSIGMTALDHH